MVIYQHNAKSLSTNSVSSTPPPKFDMTNTRPDGANFMTRPGTDENQHLDMHEKPIRIENMSSCAQAQAPYSSINSDLHARMKAFQNERSLKRNLSQNRDPLEHDVAPVVDTTDSNSNYKWHESRSTIALSPSLHAIDEHNYKKRVTHINKATNYTGPSDYPKNSLGSSQVEITKGTGKVPEFSLKTTKYPTPTIQAMHTAYEKQTNEKLPTFNNDNAMDASKQAAFVVPHDTIIKRKQSLSSRRGFNLQINSEPGLSRNAIDSKGVKTDRPIEETIIGSLSLLDNAKDHGILETNQDTAISYNLHNATDPYHNTDKKQIPMLSNISGGPFANFAEYIDINSGSLNFAGKLSLSAEGIAFINGSQMKITLDDLVFLEELGRGNYGCVSKAIHKPTNFFMAVKEVRLELDETNFKQILMELDVLHKCNSPYVVDFYGAFFVEGAVYICMEYMDGGSLNKIYNEDPEIGGIDEPQLQFITYCAVMGLNELKNQHNVIHRDVKPSNILCSANNGSIKLCDFGVSGNLVSSLAKTNIGCQSYMAPERIQSMDPGSTTYTIQADIWSLGLSILEMAMGRYPYPPDTYSNIFSQLNAIVRGEPPKLPGDRFSKSAQHFVTVCLQKEYKERPNYADLLKHPWLSKYHHPESVGMKEYITERLKKSRQVLLTRGQNSIRTSLPALHKGGL